ncbi:MAG: YceI family protein [Gemmatimonadota bacterium]
MEQAKIGGGAAHLHPNVMNAARPFTSDPDTVTLGSDNVRVSFAISWLGGVRVSGVFTRLSGMVVLPGPDLQNAMVEMNVDAASVSTGIRLRDHHLAGSDFLDARNHPTINFRSDEVSRRGGSILVSGNLSLRGCERRVTAECSLNPGSAATSVVVLTAAFKVARRDFNIGVPRGLRRIDPLFMVIGDETQINVEALVPAGYLLPRMLPALGR